MGNVNTRNLIGAIMKKSEKTESTIAKIIKAAMNEFGANGYVCGKVNNICKSGINKGLIYHNFKDKDELYLKCLEKSCETLVKIITESGSSSDLLRYMSVRISYFKEYPNEAHILFEAILQPQEHLRNEIQKILQPFEDVNEKIRRSVVSSVKLRDGITEEDAMEYFRQMQHMFNGYFAARNIPFDEMLNKHEAYLPKLLNIMLYGIAKGGNE